MIASAGGLFVAGNEVATPTEARVAAVEVDDKPVFRGVSFDSAWRLDMPVETPQKCPGGAAALHRDAKPEPTEALPRDDKPEPTEALPRDDKPEPTEPLPRDDKPEPVVGGSPDFTATSLASTPTPSETPSRSDKKARKKFDKYYHRTL